MAMVIAVGVMDSGERQILGYDLGPSEDGAFWLEFLRSLVARGLKGVRLVISDSHQGLKQATQSVLQGATWQRCKVHLMRNVLAHVPKGAQQMVAASIRTIFIQQDQESARAQLGQVAAGLEKRFPRAAETLLDAEEDILAFMAFPPEHWRQIYSTNPLARLQRLAAVPVPTVPRVVSFRTMLRVAQVLRHLSHQDFLKRRLEELVNLLNWKY